MDQQPNISAPSPTVRRLPAYHAVLLRLRRELGESVSCTRIAAELGADPTQVRKDLAVTGVVGRPKVGYPTEPLLEAIENFLGWNNVTDAFLVGAGSLGTALLGFGGFEARGLNIVAAFDSNPAKVNTTIHGKHVLAVERMGELARRMHTQVGILTVPAVAAQASADLLVAAGIKAIWNLTPVRLDVPDSVIVENQDLSASLAVLSARLAENRRRMHLAEQEN